MDHTCDLYHIRKSDKSPGYKLPKSPKLEYLDQPDEVNVPCHFTQAGSGGTTNTLVQNEPKHDYDDRIKVNFLLDADIRVNDKVLDQRTGMVYYAELPRTIRGHHKYVYVKRERSEEAL